MFPVNLVHYPLKCKSEGSVFMNQEKIGGFIAECRKNKKITQQQLAEKLGVSDRTIGNWENGRNMPDLSLFEPLCNELEITINELLSGERVRPEDNQDKLMENIISTINYSNKKIISTRKRLVICFSALLAVVLLVVSAFVIDVGKMSKNEPVVFNTWGFDYAPPVNLEQEYIELAIKEFILAQYDKEKIYSENEKGFVSLKTYLVEQKSESEYIAYTWVLSERYYMEENEVRMGDGFSIPHRFTIKKSNDKYSVLDSQTPRDGSLYAEDMQTLFPRSVRNEMDKVWTDGTIEKLIFDIKQQRKLHFGEEFQ